MRVSTACSACRSRRRKCVIPPGGSSCTYCVNRNLHCTNGTLALSPKTHERPIISAPRCLQERGRESRADLPPVSLCTELVELYFDFIHDQFHHLFHRPSFMEDVLHKKVPPVILYAIMALSARFSTNPAFADVNPWERSTAYAKEAAVLLDVCDVSLHTIQACVLLGTLNRTEGQATSETIHYSIACRMAQLLDLAKRPAQNAIEREVNLRVWWTLSKVDVWSSAGVGLPRQMPLTASLPLPVDERLFLSWSPSVPVTTDRGDTASSLYGQMLILTRVLTSIIDFHQATVAGTNSPSSLSTTINSLSHSLDSWYNTLPSHMRDTPTNMQAYADQGLGRIFVALHIGYYHCGQLLFYQFLQEDCHSSIDPQAAQTYASKCRAHATSLCNLLYTSSQTPSCKVLYTMVGHDLVIASTVQIHTLLFSSSENEIRAARERLERNFGILIELRRYWPILEVSFMRFRTFREACRQSMDTSFKLDQWLLRFLYEFARPVEKREGDTPVEGEERRAWTDTGLWSVENIGINT